MSHGELCLKTEYGNNEGRIDAYIVSSGEFFWGGTSLIADQRKVLVEPMPHMDKKALEFAVLVRELEGLRSIGRLVANCPEMMNAAPADIEAILHPYRKLHP